jgi:hypothetical protein
LSYASGAKAIEEKKGFIAALKALRHPKPEMLHPKPETLCQTRPSFLQTVQL